MSRAVKTIVIRMTLRNKRYSTVNGNNGASSCPLFLLITRLPVSTKVFKRYFLRREMKVDNDALVCSKKSGCDSAAAVTAVSVKKIKVDKAIKRCF